MDSDNANEPTIPSFTAYVEDRKYLKNVSAKTLAWYTDCWKAFGPYIEPALSAGSSLKDAVRTGIQALLKRGMKPVSVNSYLTCVRAYLYWLYNEGHLKTKPAVHLIKHEHKVIETFSPEQCTRLLKFQPKGANERRAHALACLLLDTGLRRNEALYLKSEAVDLDNLVLKVQRKGNKQQLVPMSREMRGMLYRYMKRSKPAPGDYIFSTRNKTAVTPRNFQRDFKAIIKKLGITNVRASPHTLRHTFSVNFLRAGGNLYYLSKILGHTSVKTTERYLQSIQIDDLKNGHNGINKIKH